MARKMLVTSALPYANGSIHLGHLVEYIQTDIWARVQRLQGHHCYYVCADDAHGTPIMLRARQEGISPEELIERMQEEHSADFRDFLVEFDSYYTTHSRENEKLATLIYERLQEGGHIYRKTISQAYDTAAEMFLPDRFIKGTCPVCRAPDQYGDACEECGSTYSPAELIDPASVISGERPTEKDSEHVFFRLADFEEFLKDWTGEHRLQTEIRNKLEEWFKGGLRDWDISRDEPYWGFEIPDAPGKFFYVWLDAPIGYMASFQALCKDRGISFEEFWAEASDAELYHFIGKDIAYFHTLFWPAMLRGAGFRTPTAVYVHGFLTVNGQKMSKSRGTFIRARTYLNHLDPEYLRYYFAAKLGSGVEDIDLNLDDFVQRVNSDLVGKYANLASRCAGFITKRFEGRLSDEIPDPRLYDRFLEEKGTIGQLYESRQYGKAMRRIMGLADEANRYIDDEKPWVTIKDDSRRREAQAVCSQGLNLFRLLTAYLKPVLPRKTEQVESFLQADPITWENLAKPLKDHPVDSFKPLVRRIEEDQLAAVLEESRGEGDR